MKFLAVVCTVTVAIVVLGVLSPCSAETVQKAQKVRYDNFAVYKVMVENERQLAIVRHLSELTNEYNLWKPATGVGSDLHIMVNPRVSKNFGAWMKMFGFKTELLVPDVQSLIDEETSSSTRSADGAFDWTSYHTLDEINAWLDDIVAQYPNIVTSYVIGKSYEGRDIRGIKISYKAGNPGIFIESNIHAREWITSATVTYFINELLTSTRPELVNFRENIDWYIIPVYNVDGFVYSHQTDRMWRKTRQPVSTSSCIGTDANRNFNSHWMENNGASSNPCSQTYAGTKPFSEPEAQALADFVTSIKDKLNIYLSFHSYGQYLLCPYGHTAEDFPENYNDLVAIGEAAANAIKATGYGTEYTYGSTASVLYVASGSTVDWVFGELGVKVGYTLEFRDKGRYGFVLPPVYIRTNALETIEGLIALVAKSKELGYI